MYVEENARWRSRRVVSASKMSPTFQILTISFPLKRLPFPIKDVVMVLKGLIFRSYWSGNECQSPIGTLATAVSGDVCCVTWRSPSLSMYDLAAAMLEYTNPLSDDNSKLFLEGYQTISIEPQVNLSKSLPRDSKFIFSHNWLIF